MYKEFKVDLTNAQGIKVLHGKTVRLTLSRTTVQILYVRGSYQNLLEKDPWNVQNLPDRQKYHSLPILFCHCSGYALPEGIVISTSSNFMDTCVFYCKVRNLSVIGAPRPESIETAAQSNGKKHWKQHMSAESNTFQPIVFD
jgi:hypothetical protein